MDSELITLEIDGQSVSVPAGTTILEAAKAAGIEIPNLCYLKELGPYGACGVCVVEVKDCPKMLRACSAKVAPGMVVYTKSEKALATRKLALDLLMGDLKIWDSDAHRRWTGAGNERILGNLQRLSKAGIPLILRTPVIPGVNDTEEAIVPIAAYAAGLRSLRYYELLNYNPLGSSKYEALGRTDPFRKARPLPEARMEELRKAAERQGIPVRVG